VDYDRPSVVQSAAAAKFLQMEADWEAARLLMLQGAWMANNRAPGKRNPRVLLVTLCLMAIATFAASMSTRNATKEAELNAKLAKFGGQLKPVVPMQTFQPAEDTMCELCIQEGVAYINILLNEILNNGIIYDCGDLCQTYLPNKYEQDFCDVMCDGVGIYEFIELLMTTDLDGILIYGCEEIDACPISVCNGTCMVPLNFVAKPNPANVGTTVQFLFTVNITQPWTGTGVLRFLFDGPDVQGGGDQLIAGGIGPVGVQQIEIKYSTKGSKKNGGYKPGNYQATITICNGDCDPSGKLPYNQQLATDSVNLKLVKPN